MPGQGWARRRLRCGARWLLDATLLLCDTRRSGRRVRWTLHGGRLRAPRGRREEEVLGSSSGPVRTALPTQAAAGVGLRSRRRLTGAVCLGPAGLSASRGEEERALQAYLVVPGGLGACPPAGFLAPRLSEQSAGSLSVCAPGHPPWPPRPAPGPAVAAPPPITTPPDHRALKAGPWGSLVLRRSSVTARGESSWPFPSTGSHLFPGVCPARRAPPALGSAFPWSAARRGLHHPGPQRPADRRALLRGGRGSAWDLFPRGRQGPGGPGPSAEDRAVWPIPSRCRSGQWGRPPRAWV